VDPLASQPVLAASWRTYVADRVAVVDCDVHQIVRDFDQLLPYLPRYYREQVADQGFLIPSSGYFSAPKRASRTDLAGDDAGENYDGRHIGWDFDLLVREHLDAWKIDQVLLTGGSVYNASILPDADYAAALCRAFNDWTIEHWTARDPRLKAAMAVSTGDPNLAVREIDRIAPRSDVVAVLLPSGARVPYGSRCYHSIYEACQRHRLAVCIHPGAEATGMAGSPTGVGYPTYYLETRMARSQMAMAHCASLICEGVFERFPSLSFAFLEMDQFWVPGFLWKMDADWKSLRQQTPWLKQLPSETFRKHIRIGSQPMVEPEAPNQLEELWGAMHAEETLIYCSDWPHFDWDDPAMAYQRVPEKMRLSVFSDNARILLGLPMAERLETKC